MSVIKAKRDKIQDKKLTSDLTLPLPFQLVVDILTNLIFYFSAAL